MVDQGRVVPHVAAGLVHDEKVSSSSVREKGRSLIVEHIDGRMLMKSLKIRSKWFRIGVYQSWKLEVRA